MPAAIIKKQKIAKTLLEDPNLRNYIEAGFINEVDVRNCRIITDYMTFRNEYKHLDALDKLSEKYFLSTNHLLHILYHKPKNKCMIA